MSATLVGACHCQMVRYEVDGDLTDETLCHCTICRQTSGAPLVAWFTVSRDRFRLTSGEPTRYQSSEQGTRTFCPRCGTLLTFASSEHPTTIDVTTCSLTDPQRVPPREHTFTRSRIAWMATAGKLPEFPGPRS